jgi:Protein of unknown function (DUF1549)/Protein of unknown function (DUF1553)/Planctomycete cytochrome C
MRRRLVFSCLLAFVTAGAARAQDAGVEFFETKIRPVLVEHCYQCHSHHAKKHRSELYVDSRAGLRKGGEIGPAVVPGKPTASVLIRALRHVDPDLKMPPAPAPKLPENVIADFEKWIALGAPDPRDGTGAKNAGIDFAAAARHWAYRPLHTPVVPAVKDARWASAPLDRFLLALLEARGLTPSPKTDRRTLIRRAYYDLIGLPPTADEVDAFVADRAADAFTKVVDRLLASPHYGERWGRHWLDVARFADTKDGVLMFGPDRVRPYAYTYRDYVVKALNADTPFDRFVQEQLAADQIQPKVEPWRLAAMGYLTLGRMFDNNQHDVIDDRIDVVTRGLLGLTVACARCHDHKYDAIPQKDYYSLYGVFASSEAPLELPLIERPEGVAGFAEFEKKSAPKREKLQKMLDVQFALLSEQTRRRAGDYLVRVATTAPDPLETAIFFVSLAPGDLRPQVVARWRRYLASPARADDPVFGPWQDFMKLPPANYAAAAKAVAERWRAQAKLNPLVYAALGTVKLASKADVAKMYSDLLLRAYDDKTPRPEIRQLAERVAGKDSPCYFPKSQTYYYMSRSEKDQYGTLLTEMDKLAVQSPSAPARAMVLYDAADVQEPRVFVRGNAAVPGAAVPRQFLRVLAGEQRQPFAHGSGRLDLARAIADSPLAARVLVNRVWMHHFGEPLVPTPSDFGNRSTPPAQPELLDYLAWTFKAEGGSLKKLHRLMMLSSAYQQASADRPACREADPDNKLLWRFERRRLDFEAVRDTLLAVAGRLDPKMYGRPVDVAGDAHNQRRTLYGLVDRQSLPGLYRAFDFASPDQSAERRPMTTVPQQALFGMNAPFVIEQAKALAARPEVAGTPEQRIAALYRLVLARTPRPEETQAGLRFIARSQTGSQLSAWQQYAQVLLLTNEVLFVD